MNDKEPRELDAWIAEHVMGWVWWYCKQSNEAMLVRPGPDWPLHKNFKLVRGRPQRCTDNAHLAVDNYTTDPDAALAVLEKCLKNHRPHGGIVIYDSQVSSIPCYTVAAQAIGSLRAQAETLPRAIALFAKQMFSK